MRLRSAVVLSFLLLPFAGAIAASEVHLSALRGHDGSREVVIRRGATPRRMARANGLRPKTNATVTVNAGADVDAANNDYRRIQDAIDAAASGDTIILAGTFDFTQPFAAAAWALGDDNTAGTGDDYSVFVPPGMNGVTVTASSLGSATIQGPGDLAAADLESFLVFDGGDNANWTMSNLRILDFDVAIFMFSEPVSSVTAFNNTIIQNNFIRVPADLNATVAPVDESQNIGIYYSYGTNQSIVGNTIELAGDGVSDSVGGNQAASVGIECDTGFGPYYDGLNISNNSIHVLHAQSSDPEIVLGIWENGHSHTSNISVSGNTFVNDDAGNDPALNLQRALRLTSHSSATTLVTYDANQLSGANIGIQWLTGADFTGNQAILLTNDQVTNCDTGVLVSSNGLAHLETDVIIGSGSGGGVQVSSGTLTGSGANVNGIFRTRVSGGSADGVWITATAGAIAPVAQNDLGGNAGFGLRNDSAAAIVAEQNWWGNNLAAPVAAEASGNTDFDPWLASGTDVSATLGFQPFLYATTSGTLTTFAGTSVADIGALVAGDPVTMTMDGQTAFTPLAQLLSFSVQLGGGDDLFTLGQTGVPTIIDGGAGSDTLAGSNVAQTWNITGPGSGNIPGATSAFTTFESLRGGSAGDTFVFGATGSLAGSVDGSLGVDSLDNSAIPGHTITATGPGTLDGFMGTATGIGTTFDNINLLAGTTADLSITKSGPATTTTGSQITYNIAVANSGPDTATNVVVTDALPAGVTFVSVTPSQGTCSGTTTVTCNLGTLANGASATIALVVTVTATSGSITNTATVTATENDPTPANTTATSTTTLPATSTTNVPTADPAMLLLLVMLLAVLAVVKMKT